VYKNTANLASLKRVRSGKLGNHMVEVRTDFHELARRLRARDEGAYELVIELFAGRIICYLAKKGIPYEEAKDITSDTMSKLWEKGCEGYDPNRSSFWTWVSKVALNLALDSARRNQRIKLVALTEARSTIDPRRIDEKYSGKCDWELVERAIQSLDKKVQTVIRLKADGFTYEEMAEILNCSPTAAGMRVTRAVQELRDAIERLNNDESRGSNYGPRKPNSS
jgi:RNA polymerase sigma factor (sigma-70 family)